MPGLRNSDYAANILKSKYFEQWYHTAFFVHQFSLWIAEYIPALPISSQSMWYYLLLWRQVFSQTVEGQSVDGEVQYRLRPLNRDHRTEQLKPELHALKSRGLRVVQTQAILFLKSMSERVGYDIERLWNSIPWSTQNQLKMMLFKFSVVLCRIRLFPTLISKIKWLGFELPLKAPIS